MRFGLNERDELARLLPAPAVRGLSGERHRVIKEFLVSELREAPAPGRRTVRRRLWRRPAVLVPALAAATAVAVGLSATVGQPPAYAVTRNSDGSITIEINRWENAKQLQADLRAMNVRVVVDFVPGGKRCHPPRIADPVPREQYRKSLLTFAETDRVAEGFVTRLRPSVLKPGQTAVIEYYHPQGAGARSTGGCPTGP